jgi:UDP-N-acetylglucosamine 2-epimerase (hydrolysing)
MFHPVTTEFENMKLYAKQLVDALLETQNNYVVIFPNNDLGSNLILNEFERFNGKSNFKLFPSIRFEYFLVLLKYSKFIIGNSSAGIREAPYYGIPTINIGTRQQNRALHDDIINCDYSKEEILGAIKISYQSEFKIVDLFGKGNSDELFLKSITSSQFWEISKQKVFKDIN